MLRRREAVLSALALIPSGCRGQTKKSPPPAPSPSAAPMAASGQVSLDNGARYMAPTLAASVGLLDALIKRADMFHGEMKPTPP